MAAFWCRGLILWVNDVGKLLGLGENRFLKIKSNMGEKQMYTGNLQLSPFPPFMEPTGAVFLCLRKVTEV